MKKNYILYSDLNRNSSDRIWQTKSGFPLKKFQLPNVDYFRVIRGGFDELALEFGLFKRKNTFILSTKNHNKGANIYLAKMIDRLHVYAKRKDTDKFEKLMQILMYRSKSYRALILWRVKPTWYKSLTLTALKRFIKKVEPILKGLNVEFKSERFWIPKPDGTLRPITSPSPEWRFASNMQYSFWTIWLNANPVSSIACQHGGLPNRGTMTALKDLEKRCLDSKFIYEFDLTKYFDRITWMSILHMSNRLEIPKELFKWAFNAVVNLDMKMYKGKLLETKEMLKSGLFDLKAFRDLSILDATQLLARRLNNWKNKEELRTMELAMFEPKNLKRFKGLTYSQIEEILSEEIGIILDRGHGVPQGFSLSPLLAVLCLDRFYYGWDENLVMYMDDGILFGETEEALQLPNVAKLIEHDTGSAINFKKSGWIKREGHWLRPLPFLGVEYNPWNETFHGKTRNGSAVEIPRRKIKDLKLSSFTIGSYSLREEIPLNPREHLLKGREGVKTDIFGLLLSFMYNNGITDNSKFRKIFTLEERKNSMCSEIRRSGKPLTLFNASSYSSPLLMRLWSETETKKSITLT